MKRLVLLSLLCCTLYSHAQSSVNAHQAKVPQWITGTWTLVSVENSYPNGDKVYPYGAHPKGMLIFDVSGNYTLQIYKDERISVASGDKNKATPEENIALVQGSNAHFGKYAIDGPHQLITFLIAYASFPNWDSQIQKRSYSYRNNQLKYVVTNTTQGGQSVTAEVTWEHYYP
ncbi:Lipocalin-like domain-containing protein [Pedobacter westerhofensis]|uniref:Lipocalin-like domain-containing protein n=1 Tax=Pedobacter westerhofensis TaxID=425512 RepID=A0A521FLI2_9SPHI|nr:lipocalin-like domain-containing protein [Pedobacter westerhofensis]SMO96440.1 Lipocalin-like domain-containing protein [Pedobacter westerhofensis]